MLVLPSWALWCNPLRTNQTPRCCRSDTHRSRLPWRADRESSGRSLYRGRSGTGSLCGRATQPPLCRSASPQVGWTSRDAAFSLPAQCCGRGRFVDRWQTYNSRESNTGRNKLQTIIFVTLFTPSQQVLVTKIVERHIYRRFRYPMRRNRYMHWTVP